MLSIQPLKSAKSAAEYYTAAFQYYAGDATATLWMGEGRKYLKLEHQVEKEPLLAMLEGKLPNGQKLKNLQGEHRPGFDMTFSAPKSVSLLVGLGVAPDLIKYHDEAVEKAIKQIEKEFAEARVSRDGAIHYEKTGNLLVAAFRQPSSRANDPALHTHCVTLNLTFHDGKARSLSSDSTRTHGVIEQIQNNAHYCGLLYRQNLANCLKEAGFILRSTGDGLFEIDGVPEEVLQAFSKRREAIETLMKAEGWIGAKSASVATLLTRSGKEEHDFESLQSTWKADAQALGFDAQKFMLTYREMDRQPSFMNLLKEKWQALWQSKEAPATICVKMAVETLSQRTSTFTERDLKKESMKHGLLCEEVIPYQQIEAAIQQEKIAEALYSGVCPQTKETLLTTPWLLTLEVETIERVERNKGVVTPISTQLEVQTFLKERRAYLEHGMTRSQKEALVNLFVQQDRITAIQGYAGTAKTTMLSEAKLLMEKKGYQLQGITVASSAAFELETKSGIPSQVFPVVYQQLNRAATGSLTKMLYIVDEASMLSSPQAHELLKHIERTQARLVLVGDKAQLPSVNNGRAFGLLQEYGIQKSMMDDIVRQKNKTLKEAVLHAAKGEVKLAMEKLNIEELPTHQERIKRIAEEWISRSPDTREKTLLFAARHVDREAITTHIRAALQEEKTLSGATLSQVVLKPKALEPNQIRIAAHYQAGDVLRFNQNFHKDLKQGEYLVVGKISKKHRQDNVLPLTHRNGKTLLFALSKLPAYKNYTAAFERPIEVYQSKTLDLQAGDKVMWTRNLKNENIRNCEILTVQKIEENQLILVTKSGQPLTFPKEHPALRHLDYSYVLTNYKVQGKDADYAIGLMESYHRYGATIKNFYVQISRAVKEMTMVTDNREMLTQAIQQNKDDKTASLDILSSRQLKRHEERFTSQTHLPMQAVIEKKRQFELER